MKVAISIGELLPKQFRYDNLYIIGPTGQFIYNRSKGHAKILFILAMNELVKQEDLDKTQ